MKTYLTLYIDEANIEYPQADIEAESWEEAEEILEELIRDWQIPKGTKVVGESIE